MGKINKNQARKRLRGFVRHYSSGFNYLFTSATNTELLVLLYKSISSILSRGGEVSSTAEFCTTLAQAVPHSTEEEILDIISDSFFDALVESKNH